jgi:hypothetical protein
MKQAIQERMAPGHVYQPQLGSGVEWQAGTVKLWERGEVTFEASHHTDSQYEFWRSLAFADCFPDVTHWWFRSAWTQRVRLTRAQGMLGDDTIWGYIQFIDEHIPAQVWTISEKNVPVIEVPYPPNENQPVNLPLRLALSNLVAGILSDDVVPDTWMVVTSLVEREQLALTFPEYENNGFYYRLAGIDTSLRDALCWLQGLKEIVPAQV